MKSTPEFRPLLCIGGLDPSGGAGLFADARAAAAFGVHACCVTTAVIAQNTQGVARVEVVSLAMLDAQLENLLEDVEVGAAKIGMLPSREAVEIVVQRLQKLRIPIVLDPVLAPSAGAAFSDAATIEAIAAHLFPLCELVTPNTIEAARLSQITIIDTQSARDAARAMQNCGARNVLIKGGHAPQMANETGAEVVDWLLLSDEFIELRAPRVSGTEVRGTGCLLASAIAAQRAHGIALEAAARAAKSWLTQKIRDAQSIGKGRRVAI